MTGGFSIDLATAKLPYHRIPRVRSLCHLAPSILLVFSSMAMEWLVESGDEGLVGPRVSEINAHTAGCVNRGGGGACRKTVTTPRVYGNY